MTEDKCNDGQECTKQFGAAQLSIKVHCCILVHSGALYPGAAHQL